MINNICFFSLSLELNCQRKVVQLDLIPTHPHTHTNNTHWHGKPEWSGMLICITSTYRSDWEKVVASEWTINTEPRVTPCMLPGSQHQNTKLWIKQNTGQSNVNRACGMLVWNLERISGKTWLEKTLLKGEEKNIYMCIFITNDFAFSSSSMH